MVKCLIITFNPVLRVLVCFVNPAVVSGSPWDPLLQHGIHPQSCNLSPQNGIVHGFAVYCRYGTSLNIQMPVLR
jgi:hypothetical protein